jgi:hypothetical protein
MFISQLRHQLWHLIRDGVQHEAHWSNCNAEVLLGVAKLCREGGRRLGYFVSEPPENRTPDFYKNWITQVTNGMLGALERLDIPDGSMTHARPTFQEAADRVKKCGVAAAVEESDEPFIRPLEAA